MRKTFSARRVSATGVVPELPSVTAYSELSSPIDLLIVAAGFEERVLAIPKRLIEDGVSIRHRILVGNYDTNRVDNEQRFRELGNVLERFKADIKHFNAEDPSEIAASINEAVAGVPGEGEMRVAMDISGSSSTLILSAMAALQRQERCVSLDVLYATAREYGPAPTEQRAIDQLELSGGDQATEQGVSRVSHNELCAGIHHDHLPATVIALPSMYTERLESCLSHLNVGPMTGSNDNLYWILPHTEAHEHAWRQHATRKSVEALIRKYEGRDANDDVINLEGQIAFCDVSSYQHCLELVVQKIDQFQGRNISLVHMGSKMQAIGVALAVAARSEVAVVTARPLAFNAKTYSSGVGTLHRLHFPDLGKVTRLISEIGSIRVDA